MLICKNKYYESEVLIMILTKEHCDIIMKDAFKDTNIPEYSVEDVNRALSECSDVIRKAVRLIIVEGKSSWEAGFIMGYGWSNRYHARTLYNKFLQKVRVAPKYNWYKRGELIVDKNSTVDYLLLSNRANNCLRRANISTVGELCECTYQDIKNMSCAGPRTVEEITQKLTELGFKLKNDPHEDLEEDGKLPPDSEIKSNFATTVISEMLPIIRSKCMKRTKRYGYEQACNSCPYRGVEDVDCMFNLQPRIWIVEKK